MSDSKSTGSGGIGFFGLLGIVFITLKLTGYIDWPWLWVTCPLWGPIALVLAVIATLTVCGFVGWLIIAAIEWTVEGRVKTKP